MVPLNELYLGKECKTGFFSYLNYNEKMYGCIVFFSGNMFVYNGMW